MFKLLKFGYPVGYRKLNMVTCGSTHIWETLKQFPQLQNAYSKPHINAKFWNESLGILMILSYH